MSTPRLGAWAQYRAAPKIIQLGVPIVCIGLIIGAASGGNQKAAPVPVATQSVVQTPRSAPVPPRAVASCGYRATDSCTPRVDSTAAVRVDALAWNIVKAYRTQALPTTPDTADAGESYLVAILHVHSLKTDTATLNTDAVKLKVGNKTYEQDQDSLDDWSAPHEITIDDQDIEADQTLTTAVIFTVPSQVLSEQPQLQFNELGPFGETHGYISLPQPLHRHATPKPAPTPGCPAGESPDALGYCVTPTPAAPAQSVEAEDVGSLSHAGDAEFCSTHSCIASFSNGAGAVVQCADGEYSHSGGIQGACSDHGGEE